MVNTADGYYNTKTDRARLYGRSTLVDKDKTITGDSLYYVKDGNSQGFGNVIYNDKRNRNPFTATICVIMKRQDMVLPPAIQ